MQIYAIELESMQTERLPHVRPAFLSKRFNQSHVWAGPLEFCWQQHPVSRNTMTKNNQICIIKHIMKTTPEENGSLFCSTCHFFVASHDSLGHSHGWRLWWGHGGRLPGGNGEGENKKTYIMNMGVSENSGTPKSSILMSLSIINHPCWGTPIFGNTHNIIFRTWNTIRSIPSTSFHFRKKSLSTFDFSMDFFSPFKSQTNGGLNRFPKISVHSSPHAAAVCFYSTHLNTTAGWDPWKGIWCTLHFTAP